ncbi:hypothetical protein GW950_00400 [Candidatus Wolfebacteria bacterium]|nr:hypothetical protein [Candidatus Wolfebacteria bacterium]
MTTAPKNKINIRENLPEGKLSMTEIVFGSMIVVLIDAIGFLLLWFMMDDFLMLDLLMMAFNSYLWVKGLAKFQKLIIPVILELFPYIGALPIYSIAWIIIVWVDRHPESALATAEKLTKFSKK